MNFYNIKRIVLASCLFLNCVIATADTNRIDNMTILVSSCDKYAPLWDPFFSSLFKQWPSLLTTNKQLPILLIANNKSYAQARVQMVNIPQERSWSDNMLQALQLVNTKYVLLMLDDYWVINPVQEAEILNILRVMQQENIAMTQLAYNNPNFHYGTKHAYLRNAIYTNKYAAYKTSLQVAIWDKQALQFLLKSGENPWQFENNGTTRSHGYPGVFLNIEKEYPIEYLNATRQGHIEQFAVDYVLANNIVFDRGDLPVMDKYKLKLVQQNIKNKATKFIGILEESYNSKR